MIQTRKGPANSLIWVVVLAIIAAGVVGNHFYADKSLLLRIVVLLIMGGLALFLALQTEKGHKIKTFALEARTEMRKIVWPGRQETIQTTIIVLVMVTVVGLVLWGIDALLLKAIAMLTGYGAV